MRALTVRQPWAELEASGAKSIEVRTWATSYRGPLAIHAGLTDAQEAIEGLVAWAARRADDIRPAVAGWPRGAIVAVVDLQDIRNLQPADEACACVPYRPDAYAWVLANPHRLREPVPARGHRGLWTLTAQQQAAVEAAR